MTKFLVLEVIDYVTSQSFSAPNSKANVLVSSFDYYRLSTYVKEQK